MPIEVDLDSDEEVLIPNPQAKALAPVDPEEVVVVPQIESLLTDSAAMLNLAQAEILRRLGQEGSADPSTIRAVSALVDSVTKLSKEDRLRAKEFEGGLSGMTDEELLELMEESKDE